MKFHQEIHGITSITSNTTMKSHQEFHGIMSNSYHDHVSLTNHNLSSITISRKYPNNQPTRIHEFIHTKLFNSSTYNQIIHAYFHILNALNRVIQSIMQPTTKNMEENSVRACSCTSLAQAIGPHSGERGLSLKL